MVNALGAGFAHFPSDVLPATKELLALGDQLAACVTAARRHGIRVHAWKICWNLERAPQEFVDRMKREGRLQSSDTGQVLPWLCPAQAENLRHEKDSVREMVRRYDLDGVHLDYNRFQNSHACYCDACRQGFEKSIRRSMPRWPEDAQAGELGNRYGEWRRGLITRLVRDLSGAIRQIKPSVKLSAAVYATYPSCANSIAQDWPDWVRSDYVAFVCPMNYTTNLTAFARLLANQSAIPGVRDRIFPGIGVTATESRLSAVQVIDQVLACRRTGAGGYALFDLSPALESEVLPALRKGLSRAP
jgi:uncharacterized lipoprotein YddW (UPF0748 family)